MICLIGWIYTNQSDNSAERWADAKCRAISLREVRDKLHPGLLAEMEELERFGY
jgi:hypothetical protein